MKLENTTIRVHGTFVYTIQWNKRKLKVRSFTNILFSKLVQDCVQQLKLKDQTISHYSLHTSLGKILKSTDMIPINGLSETLTLLYLNKIELTVKKENILLTTKIGLFDTVQNLKKVLLIIFG